MRRVCRAVIWSVSSLVLVRLAWLSVFLQAAAGVPPSSWMAWGAAVNVLWVLPFVGCWDGWGDFQEGRPWVGERGAAALAGLVVAVGPTCGAESGAVGLAERLHGEADCDVLAGGFGEVEDVVFVDDEAFVCFAVVEYSGAACWVEEGQGFFVDGYGDWLDAGFEAASALGFDRGAQLGGNPDGLVGLDEVDCSCDLDFAVWNGEAFVDGVLPCGAAWLSCELGNVKVHNDTAPLGRSTRPRAA